MHVLFTNQGMHGSSIGLTTNFCVSLEARVVMCTYFHYILLPIGIKMRYIIYLHISLENVYTTVKCIFNECTQTFVKLDIQSCPESTYHYIIYCNNDNNIIRYCFKNITL